MGNPSNGPATKNGSFVSITMVEYNFPGCVAVNCELVEKDLGTSKLGTCREKKK